jgi:hypothetical protein
VCFRPFLSQGLAVVVTTTTSKRAAQRPLNARLPDTRASCYRRICLVIDRQSRSSGKVMHRQGMIYQVKVHVRPSQSDEQWNLEPES